MKYKKYTTDEGSVICYTKNRINDITIVDISFACGARCETIPGQAHFVEHMFFSGTKTMTKEQTHKKYFDFINVNAYTNPFEIVFTGDIFTKELGDYLDTVATLITESTFSEKAVEKERGIILQELAGSIDNYKKSANNFDIFNFSGNKIYDYDIIGTKASISSIKSKDIKSFVTKYFVKQNVEVFITSPLPFSKVKKLIQKNLLDRLPSNPKFQHLDLFYLYPINTNYLKFKSRKINKCYLYLNIFGDHNLFELEYKAKVNMVMRMLNNSSNGIDKDLRLMKSLVYGSYITTAYTDKTSRTTFYTECDAENIRPILETLSAYMRNLIKNGFGENQLQTAKRELQYDIDRREPKASRQISKLYDIREYGKVLDHKKLNNVAKSVTLQECNELLKEIFLTGKVTLSIYGDANKEDIPTKQEVDKLFKLNNDID